ncbi:MAG: hypothetical protein R3194_10140 [Limnobacter sp.]|nr:hypothetical protein [Limnobacter sp.]
MNTVKLTTFVFDQDLSPVDRHTVELWDHSVMNSLTQYYKVQNLGNKTVFRSEVQPLAQANRLSLAL